MIVKHVALLFFSILFAGIAAVGLSVADPPPAQAAGGKVARCGGGKIFLEAPERRLFELHNRARARRGLTRLCVHPALKRAAEAHSKDMIRRDYFSHNTKGKNESACERVRRFGYRFRYCGENMGFDSTPKRMFKAWMRSSGHRNNILSRKYRQFGIGAYTGKYKGSKRTMYTVDFGRHF